MLNFPFYCIFPLDLHNRGICRHLLSAQTHNVNLSVSKRIELTRRQRQRIFLRYPFIQLLLSICLLNHAVHVSCLVTTVFLTER